MRMPCLEAARALYEDRLHLMIETVSAAAFKDYRACIAF